MTVFFPCNLKVEKYFIFYKVQKYLLVDNGLIIQINYPHMSGGPKGPISPLQELEVEGRGPPYPLVPNIKASTC